MSDQKNSVQTEKEVNEAKENLQDKTVQNAEVKEHEADEAKEQEHDAKKDAEKAKDM